METLKPQRHVIVSSNEDEQSQQLQNYLRTAITEHMTITADRPFVVGYSGGSMPKMLVPVLKHAIEASFAARVRLFPADERLVPLTDDDNNTRHYIYALADTFGEHQFAVIRELDDGNKAADALAAKLSEWSESGARWPHIDVLFLGMGPDGHTCSLFPDHPVLEEASKWTAYVCDSPKPPPRRITITLPVVNAARSVAFILTGSGKADKLKAIIEEDTNAFPSALVRLPHDHTISYFVDKEAAAKLAAIDSATTKFSGHLTHSPHKY